MKIRISLSPLLLLLPALSEALQSSSSFLQERNAVARSTTALAAADTKRHEPAVSRRGALTAIMTTTTGALLLNNPQPAHAATRAPLGDLLYTVLRVREATEQETRLIKSGKFKDIQRANIKLAVKFMVENYRLADTFVAASAYIEGTDKRIAAGNIGQSTVQNLQTIMEYFDSSDVQNLKVGASSLAGKEQLVLRGLDAARKGMDDFLSFFPATEVDAARQKIVAENALNEKEFDPELGVIINLRQQQTTQ